LLLVLAYAVTSAIVYFLWYRFIGWPVVSGDLGEVFLRLIHLLPTLACAFVAAGIGAAINRVDKPLFPATLLAFGVGLIHYFSYSRLSRTTFGDIAAAAIESAILSVLTFTCFWMIARRLRRRDAHEHPP
jgi:NO-binding membrane sensor protein with MHYT domain